MATISTLRSRRLARRQREDTEQFITFQLRQMEFALPLDAVEKVLQMTDKDVLPEGLGLEQTIFRMPLSAWDAPMALPEGQPCLLVLKATHGDHGIILPHPPKMVRVPCSSIRPVEADDARKAAIAGLSATIELESGQPPLLVLDASQLCHP